MASGKPEAKRGLVIQRLLWWISDNGRVVLVVGLLAGLALPKVAEVLQPWLPQMVAGLLIITSLRIGHRVILGALSDLKTGLLSIVLLQMALPVAIYGLFWICGLAQTPYALAAVLATAAPALSGLPNLALMLGQDAGRTMQIMVLGTAVFPLTVMPLMMLMQQLGDPLATLRAALMLLAVIGSAALVGFSLRARLFPSPTHDQIKALDGLSVLAFSAIVVGLMAALTPALRSAPATVLVWTALAFAISYGAQFAVYLLLKRSTLGRLAGPLALSAGNRNIALFLVALPEQIVAPLLIFIGCWQLPMYLTPLLLRRLYKPEQQRD